MRVVVNVTSDKCYDNREQGRPFREDDPKGGHDPYSNSKGCAELVADAFLRSYFAPDPDGPRLGSGRAGNVIGGGDWGEDRLVPDIMRGALAGEPIRIRNPDAIRPWQHVLNPLSGYLALAQAAVGRREPGRRLELRPRSRRRPAGAPASSSASPSAGPASCSGRSTRARTRTRRARCCSTPARRTPSSAGRPPGASDDGLDATVAWYAALADGADMREATLAQIAAFSAVRS